MKNKLIELAKKSTEIVEKNNHSVYWQHGEYKFNNRNLMHWYEKEFDVFVEAVATQLPSIRENLKDKNIDPNFNYNLEFLKKIRSRYDQIDFMFSGGYDSTTVFLEAVENDIYFDYIVSHIFGEDINSEQNIEVRGNVLPLVEKYKDKFGTFEIIKNPMSRLEEIYSDPWALFTMDETGQMPFTFRRTYDGYDRRPYAKNRCYIKSLDKPQLLYYKNRWFVFAVDANYGGSMNLENQLFFWFEGDNIKSLIKDARAYRKYLISKGITPKNKDFFKVHNGTPEEHEAINRRNIYKHSNQKTKQTMYSFSEKDKITIKNAIRDDNFVMLTDYFNCLNQFYKIFPEFRTDNGFGLYNQKAKFTWLIDIDTLDVYTQQELIPNGFEE